MSKQRIRRPGADGHDRILDVDLGPSSPEVTGLAGGVTVGDMRPIITGGAAELRGVTVGDGWRAERRFDFSDAVQSPIRRRKESA